MKRFTTGHTVLLIAGLVIALALAACGGDSDSDDAGGAPSHGGAFTQSESSGEDEGRGDDGFAAAPSDGAEAPSGAIAGQGFTPSGSSGGAGGDALQSSIDRKLIRTATIQIETDSVSQKFEDIANIALSSGGLVFSSQFGNDGERQTASITIRVPNNRYEEVLSQLRRLGEVRAENSNASDVTEEYTDLQSSMNNLLATEREYLELLARAVTIDEILIVQDRVNGTRAQIDQIQGRLNLLGNQTDLATITTHLTPVIAAPPKDDGGSQSIGEVAEQAFEASTDTLRGLAIVVVAIAAFSWWLLPLAAIGVYLGRRQVKQDRARNQTPPPAPAP